MRTHYPSAPHGTRQRGAVLYVALIMLVLLAMIGIVGLQVTGLQERMSSNYRATNLAFQNAEERAREVENQIQAALTSATGTFAADQEACSPTYDPLTWAEAPARMSPAAVDAVFTRRIDKCFPASSLKMGAKKNEETGNVYQVTALRADDNGNKTSDAVIDTVFIP
jgi:type IV pilus assembly protein PilX